MHVHIAKVHCSTVLHHYYFRTKYAFTLSTLRYSFNTNINAP